MMDKCAFRENIIKNAIKVYIAISIIISGISRIVPFKVAMGEELDAYIYIVLAMIGIALLILDVFYTRYWKKSSGVYILYAFVLIMLISSIINVEYGIINNVKTIIWTAILIGLVYSFSWRCTENEISNFIIKIWRIYVVVWLIPVLLSISQFVVSSGYVVEMEGRVVRQGFYENRLFGVFNDPNYAAIMSIYAVLACLYLCALSNNKKWSCFLVIDIIIQVVYIVLSGSRTAIICIVLVACWCSCVKIYKRNTNKGFFKNLLICMCIVIIVSGSTFAVGMVLKKASILLPMSYQALVLGGDEDEGTYINQESVERDDISLENISNNRATIWGAYLKGLDEDYALGGSPRNVLLKWQHKDPEGYLSITGYETHNAYLSVLVGTGIIGLMILMIYIVFFIWRMLKYIKNIEHLTFEMEFVIAFLIVIAIYIFFFSDLFFIYNFTSILFWLHCGIAMKRFSNLDVEHI